MSSSSNGEDFQLEDILELNEPEAVTFELCTDVITRTKQTILAIPYMSFVLNGHYEEIFAPTDFSMFCLQLNILKRRIMAHPFLDAETKKKLFLTFVFHVNQFFDDIQDTVSTQSVPPH